MVNGRGVCDGGCVSDNDSGDGGYRVGNGSCVMLCLIFLRLNI